MEKLIKLWAVAFVLGVFATTFVAQSNQAYATKASVTLTWWQDIDCTLSDYIWTWLTASAAEQSLTEKTNNIVCTWWTNPTKTVTIKLDDLSAWTIWTIPANWFTGNLNATKVVNGSLVVANATVTTAWNMATAQTLFNKPVNKIGTYTGSIAIKWVVPAGTAAGTYTGSINITNQ